MGTLVVLSLGSNKGERLGNLNQAVKSLADYGEIVAQSGIYETEALGFEGDLFLNSIVLIDTSHDAPDLLRGLQSIEQKLGRLRTKPGMLESRSIDIDIIFFGKQVFKSPDLSIPHPRYQERKFVLLPLTEIAPQLTDPVTKKKISTILEACNDQSLISRYR